MYIGLDPDTVGPDNYLWKVESEGGVATLQVKTTDAKFNMATYYYVMMQANNFDDTLLNLNLQQQRTVEFIPNNHDSTYTLTHAEFNKELLYEKYQFQSNQEYVKFHVFQVPGAKLLDDDGNNLEDVFYKAKISIKALTPHFYPIVYLNKIEMNTQPTELSQLTFPTIQNYYMAFGEDPFGQLYSNDFEFSFSNFSSEIYTYYTVAIYSNNWGLTNQRKSEYQIKVEADICDDVNCGETSSPNVQQTLGPFVLKSEEKEDGSIWKWIDYEAQQAEQRAIEEAKKVEKEILEDARLAEEAALEAEEEFMKVISDSAEEGETVVIIAEEEASDEVVFDEEGNIVKPTNDQEGETKPEGETEVPTTDE